MRINALPKGISAWTRFQSREPETSSLQDHWVTTEPGKIHVTLYSCIIILFFFSPAHSNCSHCENGECVISDAGAKCVCDSGYIQGTGEHLTCEDINECESESSVCDAEYGECKNTAGAYYCSCITGFVTGGNGLTCQGRLPSNISRGVFHKDPKSNITLSWTYKLRRAICSLKMKFIQ